MISVLKAAAKAAWPYVEPLLIEAGKSLVVDLVNAAKAGQITGRFAFLNAPLAAAEADILKAVGASAS